MEIQSSPNCIRIFKLSKWAKKIAMQDKCDKYNSLFEYFSLAASAYKETQCKLTREIEKKGEKRKETAKRLTTNQYN